MEQLNMFGGAFSIDISDIKFVFDAVSEKTGIPNKFIIDPGADKPKPKQWYSLKLGSQIFCKIDKDFKYIAAPKAVLECLGVDVSNGKNIKNPNGFMRIEITKEFADILSALCDNAINNYIPEYKFGCCHRYEECSDAGHCTAPDKLHAKGCQYRVNLEQGRIFYGKNKNV